MDSKDLALLAARIIEEKKGKDITILELKGISLIADYFVLCTGTSRTQTQAISDHLEKELKKVGITLARREGYPEGSWILLDFDSVIVHIFREEERHFYSLERLWGDAPEISFEAVKG